MPDLSSDEFTIPNPYGLRAVDFSFAVDEYRAALGFLADLATGEPESEALTTNGGDPMSLVGWRRSERFRRVYAKCRAAGEAEREALRARESAQEATEGDEAGNPSGQSFIPLEALPARHSVFGGAGDPAAWGE